MEDFSVDESDELTYNTSPGGPLINDSTSLSMRTKVSGFLIGVVEKNSINTVLSIARKGTWMMDDAIRTFLKSKGITHLSFGTDSNIPEKARVMVFDDSVNTGRHMSEALDMVLRAAPDSITAVTLAITCDTLENLKTRYEGQAIGFESMMVFESYKDFNAYSELRPGCQSYYFATAILPYVNTLDSNRNPGFYNWVVGLDSSANPDSVFEHVKIYMESRGWTFNQYMKSVAFDNARHISFDRYSEETLANIHGGFSKVRFSLVDTGEAWELSVSPILCFDMKINEGTAVDECCLALSGKFIHENREGLLKTLSDLGSRDLGIRNLKPME